MPSVMHIRADLNGLNGGGIADAGEHKGGLKRGTFAIRRPGMMVLAPGISGRGQAIIIA